MRSRPTAAKRILENETFTSYDNQIYGNCVAREPPIKRLCAEISPKDIPDINPLSNCVTDTQSVLPVDIGAFLRDKIDEGGHINVHIDVNYPPQVISLQSHIHRNLEISPPASPNSHDQPLLLMWDKPQPVANFDRKRKPENVDDYDEFYSHEIKKTRFN